MKRTVYHTRANQRALWRGARRLAWLSLQGILLDLSIMLPVCQFTRIALEPG